MPRAVARGSSSMWQRQQVPESLRTAQMFWSAAVCEAPASGRARHSVRAEGRNRQERRARSDAPYPSDLLRLVLRTQPRFFAALMISFSWAELETIKAKCVTEIHNRGSQ